MTKIDAKSIIDYNLVCSNKLDFYLDKISRLAFLLIKKSSIILLLKFYLFIEWR